MLLLILKVVLQHLFFLTDISVFNNTCINIANIHTFKRFTTCLPLKVLKYCFTLQRFDSFGYFLKTAVFLPYLQKGFCSYDSEVWKPQHSKVVGNAVCLSGDKEWLFPYLLLALSFCVSGVCNDNEILELVFSICFYIFSSKVLTRDLISKVMLQHLWLYSYHTSVFNNTFFNIIKTIYF